MSQIVLITGSSQGIGLAIVEQLGKAGYRVYAGTRQPNQAKELQVLAEKMNNIKIEALDVNSDDSVDLTAIPFT